MRMVDDAILVKGRRWNNSVADFNIVGDIDAATTGVVKDLGIIARQVQGRRWINSVADFDVVGDLDAATTGVV